MSFDYEKLKSPSYFAENRVPAHSDHICVFVKPKVTQKVTQKVSSVSTGKK